MLRSIGYLANSYDKSRLKIESVPRKLSNCIWFENSRIQKYSRCKKCRDKIERCGRCKKVYDASIYLHYDIDKKSFQCALKKLGRFDFESFSEVLEFHGINSIQVLTLRNIRYFERKFKMNIDLYKEAYGSFELTRRSRIDDEDRFQLTINIAKNSFPETLNEPIEDFAIIFDDSKLPKPYKCSVLPNCLYESDSKRNLERHEKICFKASECNIQIQQKMYGAKLNELHEMIDLGILPSEAGNYNCPYLATWDIETQELLTGDEMKDFGMTEIASHQLLSIAVGSNFSDSKCWRRRESIENEDVRLIRAFLKELNRLYDLKQAKLPSYFASAEEKVDELIIQNKGSTTNNRKYFRFRRYLKSIRRLDVFGYNSSRFDMGVVAGPLFMELEKKEGLSVIKKGAAFFNASTERFGFKDVLSFTAPCKLDKFLKTWQAPCAKSIWPYSYYASVGQIKAAKKFPPRSAFKSELTGELPGMELYVQSKKEFARRRLLPKDHSEKIYSMYGWLRYYNITDVGPLAVALTNCFESYRQNFQVRPLLAYSLPSLAMTAMFANFPENTPFVMSPHSKTKEVHAKYRDSVYGGLVNVF